jgi:translation initiation factor IF-2
VNKVTKEKVGEVFNFFAKPSVAALEVLGEFKIGDKLQFLGATTDFEMVIKSMQIEGEDVEAVKKGQKVGIKVPERVRPGDEVYRITE